MRCDIRVSRLVVRQLAIVQLLMLAVLLFGLECAVTTPTRAVVAAAAGAAACAVSVAAHEASHAVVAWAHRVPVLGMEFRSFFDAGVRRRPTGRPQVSLRISLAGPAANAVLLAGCVAALAVGCGVEADVALCAVAATNFVAFASVLSRSPSSDGRRALHAWRCRPSVAAKVSRSTGKRSPAVR
jgi:Zn-dependent protease